MSDVFAKNCPYNCFTYYMALGKTCNPCHNVFCSSGWAEEPAVDSLEGVAVGDVTDGEQAVPEHMDEQPADKKQGPSTSERPLEGPTEEFKTPKSATVSDSTPVPPLDEVIVKEKPAEVPVPAAAVDETSVEDSEEPGPVVVPETPTMEIPEVKPVKTGPAEVSMEAVEAPMDEADTGPPAAATATDAADFSACVEDVGNEAGAVEDDSAVQAVADVLEVLLSTPEDAVGASEPEAPAAVETLVCDDVVPAAEKDVADAEAMEAVAVNALVEEKSNEVVIPGAGKSHDFLR